MKLSNELKRKDTKCFTHSQNIEEKLEEAEKDYEQGRMHSEEEVWSMFSKKMELIYNNNSL